MNWLLNRLKERSTWAALITLLSVAGYHLNPELQEAVITAGTAIIAVIFAITADRKPEAPNVPEPQKITTPADGVATGIDGQ